MKMYSTVTRGEHYKYTNECNRNTQSITNIKRKFKKNYRQKLKKELRKSIQDI